MKDVFLARQPILDLERDIFGFELLYRFGGLNSFDPASDPDQASSRIVIDAFQNFGLSKITGGKPAFINFSESLIMGEVAALLSPDQIIIEFLEDIEPTAQILERLQQLKKLGYRIALDDFVYAPEYDPLVDLADIIKVDFLLSRPTGRAAIERCLKGRQITLLAEKVETWEDFALAKELGFSLFQGYFFAKPEVMTANALTTLQINHMELLLRAAEPELDFTAIAEIISRDLSLTYSVLRLVNSAIFYKRLPITSVHHALTYLGERQVKRWITLIALQNVSTASAPALVTQSLVKARFAELLAPKIGLSAIGPSAFLAGLFSSLDALLRRSMGVIMDELRVADEVKQVLVAHGGPLEPVCSVVRAYMRGDWDRVESHMEELGLHFSDLSQVYLEALQWLPLYSDQ